MSFLDLIKLLVVAIGSSFFLGRVSPIEILSSLWLFLSGYKFLGKLLKPEFSRIGLCFFSCLALLVSGLINDISFQETLKGFGAYFFVPVTVFFLVTYFSYRQLWIILLISSIVTFVFPQSSQLSTDALSISQDSFKFGFSQVAICIFLTFTSYFPELRRRSGYIFANQYLSAFSLTLLSLWGNLRLLSLNAWLAALLVTLSKIRSSKSSLFINNTVSIPILAILFPSFLLLISVLLSALASLAIFFLTTLPDGLISKDVIQKTSQQMNGDFGLIFGGRIEIFSTILAWIEKPLFGWGSWAQDPGNYFRIAGRELMTRFNYDVSFADIESFRRQGYDGFIPTHSALLNLVVWSGIIGAFPFYVFVLSYLKSFLLLLSNQFLIIPYYISYSFVFSIWSILFSPIGYTNRLVLIQYIAVVIAYLRQLEILSKSTNLNASMLKQSV